MAEKETPLLDELEKGPWPSFVKEIKKAAKRSPAAADLLGLLERSFKDKRGHWKHGGIVGVTGYGAGVIGRYADLPEEFPNAAAFHTLRVNQPSSWFYSTKALRQICNIWEKYGSGLTNLHGSTGDIILLGAPTENLQPCFEELTGEAGFDLGGSGGDVRTPSCCVGPARCEFACYDTLAACYTITMAFQDEIHRPFFPYKFKIKFAGCPNDCVASIARSDLAIIGIWKDDIQVDQEAVKEYANKGLDIGADVVNKCPAQCIQWNGRLEIDNKECVRCMHCLNVMPKALRPGKERGAVILIGGKAPIMQGAILSSVLVPFMKLEPPYKELEHLIRKLLDFWGENAGTRERIGELIQRIGLGIFLEEIGLEPSPYMIAQPRDNPYIFYEIEEGGSVK